MVDAALGFRAGAVSAVMLVLSACGGDDHNRSAAVPGDFLVTLERSVCFGPCPAYTVSVDASGLVRYDGFRCVNVHGHHESQLSQARLRALMAAFREIDFFALQDSYQGDCIRGGFDGTVIVTTFRASGMEKSVQNWHGCNARDVDARLDAFERRVDALLGTAQWVPCGPGALDGDADYSQCEGPRCQ